MQEDSLLKVLRQIFGFDSFRSNQEEIIRAILQHRDVLAVMPTGGGKSLCYQLPAAILSGTCVVVSPLLSLMKDQVDSAQESGLLAASLNSTTTSRDYVDISRKLAAGTLDLLYVSPERFNSPSFLPWLQQGRITFFAIDEAHCISQWGHQFRPDYMTLKNVLAEFPDAPVAAFTATATEYVSKDIVDRLGLRDPLMVRASFDRPNLYYAVKFKEDFSKQLLDFLKTMHGTSGIVYRGTRANVEQTTEMLCRKGYKARAYHAGLSDEERNAAQEAFVNDEVSIIVATVAFGMGIDKSNVRFVVHGDMPKNIESYYQETGRAGRDGSTAKCLLLFGYKDIQLLRLFIDDLQNSAQKKVEEEHLQKMIDFAEADQCRRKALLAYFGEVYPHENCNNCDYCTDGVERTDVTIESQKALSAMQRTGNRFGIQYIINILLGEKTDKIVASQHDQLRTFGVGKDRDKKFWRLLINTLILKGFVRLNPNDGFPIVQVTEGGWRVMRGQEIVELIRQPKKKEKKKTKLSYDDTVRKEVLNGDDETNREMFEKLRKKRAELAQMRHVPPYVIFTDKSLLDMVLLKPKDRDEMLLVEGVGSKKMDSYGDEFLKVIREFLD